MADNINMPVVVAPTEGNIKSFYDFFFYVHTRLCFREKVILGF